MIFFYLYVLYHNIFIIYRAISSNYKNMSKEDDLNMVQSNT